MNEGTIKEICFQNVNSVEYCAYIKINLDLNYEKDGKKYNIYFDKEQPISIEADTVIKVKNASVIYPNRKASFILDKKDSQTWELISITYLLSD